jgi:hypothetical protein
MSLTAALFRAARLSATGRALRREPRPLNLDQDEPSTYVRYPYS